MQFTTIRYTEFIRIFSFSHAMPRCDVIHWSDVPEYYIEVTYLPSLPANGEVLTWKVMVTVGSSTDSGGSASTAVLEQMVSEIFSSPRPVIANDVASLRFSHFSTAQT